jgi:hypothetical protein
MLLVPLPLPHSPPQSPYTPQGGRALTIFLFFCQLLYLERKGDLRTQTEALAAAEETNPFPRQED